MANKQFLQSMNSLAGGLEDIGRGMQRDRRREEAADLNVDRERINQNLERVQREVTDYLRQNPEASEDDARGAIDMSGVSRYQRQGALEDEQLRGVFADAKYVVSEEQRKKAEDRKEELERYGLQTRVRAMEKDVEARLAEDPNFDVESHVQENYEFGDGEYSDLEKQMVGRMVQLSVADQDIKARRQAAYDLGDGLLQSGDWDGYRNVMKSQLGQTDDQIDASLYASAMEQFYSGDSTALHKYATSDLGDAKMRAEAQRMSKAVGEKEALERDGMMNAALHAQVTDIVDGGTVVPELSHVQSIWQAFTKEEQERLGPQWMAGTYSKWRATWASREADALISFDGLGNIAEMNPTTDVNDLKDTISAYEAVHIANGDDDAMAQMVANNTAVKPQKIVRYVSDRINGRIVDGEDNSEQLGEIERGMNIMLKAASLSQNGAKMVDLFGMDTYKRFMQLQFQMGQGLSLEQSVLRLQARADGELSGIPEPSISTTGREAIAAFVDRHYRGPEAGLAMAMVEEAMIEAGSFHKITEEVGDYVEQVVGYMMPTVGDRTIPRGRQLIDDVTANAISYRQDADQFLTGAIGHALKGAHKELTALGYNPTPEDIGIVMDATGQRIHFENKQGHWLGIPAVRREDFVSSYASTLTKDDARSKYAEALRIRREEFPKESIDQSEQWARDFARNDRYRMERELRDKWASNTKLGQARTAVEQRAANR